MTSQSPQKIHLLLCLLKELNKLPTLTTHKEMHSPMAQFEPPLPARARLTDEQHANLTKAISLEARTTAKSKG